MEQKKTTVPLCFCNLIYLSRQGRIKRCAKALTIFSRVSPKFHLNFAFERTWSLLSPKLDFLLKFLFSQVTKIAIFGRNFKVRAHIQF